MKETLLKDIYTCLYEKLQTVSNKHNVDFNELHEIYLQDLYFLYMENSYSNRNKLS